MFIFSLLTTQQKKPENNKKAGIKFHITQRNVNSVNVFVSENRILWIFKKNSFFFCLYSASLCASALAWWAFCSILSPTAEKPAPTRSPTVLSESLTFCLLVSYDAPLVASKIKTF